MPNAFEAYQRGPLSSEAFGHLPRRESSQPMSNRKRQNRDRFGYHPGTDVTIPRHEHVRSAFIAMGDILDDVLKNCDPDVVDKVFDKLHEAAMFSNFAIALMAPLQPTPDFEPSTVQPVLFNTDTSAGDSVAP